MLTLKCKGVCDNKTQVYDLLACPNTGVES